MSESNVNQDSALAAIGDHPSGHAQQTDAAIQSLLRAAESVTASNCNPDNPEDYNALLMMQMCKPIRINDAIQTQVNMVYCSVGQWEMTDPNSGEIMGKLRSVMIGDDGKAYSTNSMAVAKLLLNILRSKNGKSRFNPPLPIRFQKDRTLSGNDAIVPIIDFNAIKALNAGASGKKK